MTRILWRLYTKRRAKLVELSRVTRPIRRTRRRRCPERRTSLHVTFCVCCNRVCCRRIHHGRRWVRMKSPCLYIPCVRKRNYFTDPVGICVVYTINFTSISRCGRPQRQKNYVFLRCGRPMGLNASLYLRCGRPSC